MIAIGLFDRIIGKILQPLNICHSHIHMSIDGDVLMAIPELYRYGREHYWYGTKPFLLFLLEAVYQVSNSKCTFEAIAQFLC